MGSHHLRSRLVAALLALLVSGGVLAIEAPEPPDLTGIDLGPVLDAFGDVADALERLVEDSESQLEMLIDRAAEAARNESPDEPLICIADRGAVFLGALIASLGSLPGPDIAPDLVGYVADVALKFCRPFLAVSDPDEPGFDPADDGGVDECLLEVDQVKQQTHTTFLVLPRGTSPCSFPFSNCEPGIFQPRLDDWGPLGTPTTIHVNSDVDVRLLGDSTPDDELFTLRLGRKSLIWEAVTTISALDLAFLYIPGLPEPAKNAPKSERVFVKLFDALIGIAVDIDLFNLGAGESENDFLTRITTGQPNSFPTRVETEVSVWDLVPPVITSASGDDVIVIEGLEPGGASIKTQRQRLRNLISISDKCRTERELELLPPGNLWPVGEVSDAVWTVLDPGPNRDGERNSASVTQRIRVIDTLAPEVLAPPSQVAEIPSGDVRRYVQIGAPRTFDFVDLNPAITATFVPSAGVVQVDGGYEFPLGVTEIRYCATDGSGNDSCANGVDALATQVVNVKEEGTNTAPVADSLVGSQALAAGGFDPVEILLSGSDADFDARSGRFDPLAFRVTKAPENGFFVAPLLPYFIDDYRIPFQDSIDRCTPNRPPEVIVEPQNLRVSEAGLMYVLGAPLAVDPGCDVNDPFVLVPSNRLSIFDSNGDGEVYLAGRDLPRANDLFGFYYDEPRDRIFYSYFDFGSGPQILILDAATLETRRTFNFAELRSGIRKAVIDGNGVLYTSTGSAVVEVWDTRLAPCVDEVCELDDAKIGELSYLPPELSGGGTGVPVDLALTSDDSLIIGTLFHVYRYTPATLDDAGAATPGELVGFLGACSAGAGCDLSTRSTRGYSCTHETCTALYPSPGATPPVLSDGPGQLNSAASIAIDPNDNLYVADRNNRRVQRFTPEGFFAGTARSSCDDDDFDRCLQEGFVLANFGRPSNISVNSKHLYVLDENPALEIVHVFQTSVLTPVSDSEASIVYQSDSGYAGTDRFEFVVSDGLAVSAPATVEIDVTVSNRNAPTAGDLSLELAEDEILNFALAGGDQDFGPDPLTYRILEAPENGTLGGGPGAARSYTPRPDFFGSDRFTYLADDGDFESEPATVEITIAPVGDTPTIDLPERFEAPLNEPGYFAFTFADADPDSEHTVEIDWGDGTFEREGTLNPDGTVTGPILSENNQVTGFVFAFHSYAGPAREVDLVACIVPPTTTLGGKGTGTPADEFVCDTAVVEVGFEVFANGFE